MDRFVRTMTTLITALVVLAVATGCWSPKQGPGLSLDKQLDKIVAETGITQAHEIHIFVGYLTIVASYQGKAHRLSLWDGEIEASEVTESLGEQLRGSAPLSEFDTSALIEQYKQLDKQTSDCTKPKVTELIALTGAHIKDVHCSNPGGDSIYRPGSTTVDGQPVIDSPDLFNPHDVTTMATDRAKVIPDNGAITNWRIWLHDVSETASLPRTTTIAGGSCLPALATSGVSTAVTYIYCGWGESDTPADPNAPKPPTFRLSDYDPNLVNIVAQQIKEESGIDITQPMPSSSNLEFNPNPDGSNTITWRFASILLGTRMQITGTLAPIT